MGNESKSMPEKSSDKQPKKGMQDAPVAPVMKPQMPPAVKPDLVPAVKPETPPVPDEPEKKEGFFARWKRMREEKKRLEEVQQSTQERIEAKAAEKIATDKSKPSLKSLDKINQEIDYINKQLKKIKV